MSSVSIIPRYALISVTPDRISCALKFSLLNASRFDLAETFSAVSWLNALVALSVAFWRFVCAVVACAMTSDKDDCVDCAELITAFRSLLVLLALLIAVSRLFFAVLPVAIASFSELALLVISLLILFNSVFFVSVKSLISFFEFVVVLFISAMLSARFCSNSVIAWLTLLSDFLAFSSLAFAFFSEAAAFVADALAFVAELAALEADCEAELADPDALEADSLADLVEPLADSEYFLLCSVNFSTSDLFCSAAFKYSFALFALFSASVAFSDAFSKYSP